MQNSSAVARLKSILDKIAVGSPIDKHTTYIHATTLAAKLVESRVIVVNTSWKKVYWLFAVLTFFSGTVLVASIIKLPWIAFTLKGGRIDWTEQERLPSMLKSYN